MELCFEGQEGIGQMKMTENPEETLGRTIWRHEAV